MAGVISGLAGLLARMPRGSRIELEVDGDTAYVCHLIGPIPGLFQIDYGPELTISQAVYLLSDMGATGAVVGEMEYR